MISAFRRTPMRAVAKMMHDRLCDRRCHDGMPLLPFDATGRPSDSGAFRRAFRSYHGLSTTTFTTTLQELKRFPRDWDGVSLITYYDKARGDSPPSGPGLPDGDDGRPGRRARPRRRQRRAIFAAGRATQAKAPPSTMMLSRKRA